MEIRDVIHGTIEVSKLEEQIIDSKFFQRLRNIKQLGFAENSYPGATHNRYIHSLGAMHLAGVAFQAALRGRKVPERFLAAARASAMLHDIGHGPLSHTTEFAMPMVEKLGLSSLKCIPGAECSFEKDVYKTRRANHEDYTLKIILESSLTPVLEKALAPAGIKPLHLACVINEGLECPDDFFLDSGVDYRPLLHQLVSSEMDVDRMDYLTRDSFHAGVSYGKFDLPWIISSLTHHVVDAKCYLALEHRAIYTFDDFLLSRFHMFLMVYFHHKSVIFDEMLTRYLKSPDCDYEIPSDIEKYVFYDDYHLYTHLSTSKNAWARGIYHKTPYKMLAEFHSGIPLGEQHAEEQKWALEKIIMELRQKGVDYVLKTTTGEISKYFSPGRQGMKLPIYVRYNNKYGPEKFIPLEKCTDLYQRYPESRSITRIYVPN